MTFARPLAIHNLQMPGPTYNIYDRMATLYALWVSGGASTLYTASLPNQITTGSPGSGSYSFLLKRDTDLNGPQYNIRNVGSQATPDVRYAYVGINPDGETQDIIDSINAHKTGAVVPSNFSGTLGQSCMRYSGAGVSGVTRLLVFEFDDAVAVLGFNPTTKQVYDCCFFGDIVVPRYQDDVDGGGIYSTRLGLAAYGGDPKNEWFPNTTAPSMLRMGLGTGYAANTYSSWSTYPTKIQAAGNNIAAVYFTDFGPGGNDRFNRCYIHFYTGASIGFLKYLAMMRNVTAPFGAVYSQGGVDYLFKMARASADTDFVWIHTLASYDPLAVGSFT